MWKSLAVITLLAFFLFPDNIFAADLELIETKVVETVGQRQQLLQPDDIAEHDQDFEQVIGTKKATTIHTQDVTVHWSFFNGALSLKTIDNQLYLSIFNNKP